MAADCATCGGPLAPVPGRDFFQCENCAAFAFTQAEQDGVISQSEPAGALCPSCHNEMEHGGLDGTNILFCPNCRGILTTNPNFARIVISRRSKYQGPPPKPEPIHPDEYNRVLLCPSCRLKMQVHPYYGPGNVVVDTCSYCLLIFLDHGEIATIERYPSRERYR